MYWWGYHQIVIVFFLTLGASNIITMTSQWSRLRLKSLASRLFTKLFVQGSDQREHQSYASLAFARGIHRWPVNSSHKGPVTRKVFPFDDVIMIRHQGLGRCTFHFRDTLVVLQIIQFQFRHVYFLSVWVLFLPLAHSGRGYCRTLPPLSVRPLVSSPRPCCCPIVQLI